MRTRNSNLLNNSNVTILRRRNRERAPNVVEPELRTIVEVAPMAERTMEELLCAPTEGYGEAIVLPEINADHFAIKTNLLQLVQASPFSMGEGMGRHPYSAPGFCFGREEWSLGRLAVLAPRSYNKLRPDQRVFIGHDHEFFKFSFELSFCDPAVLHIKVVLRNGSITDINILGAAISFRTFGLAFLHSKRVLREPNDQYNTSFSTRHDMAGISR
ncbi:hypothetical protein Tco_0658272 [Tanacetum coccineum]